LYCKFGTGDDVVRSANELLTSAALGMLVASPINLNNALIECPLLQVRCYFFHLIFFPRVIHSVQFVFA
jgi:hypothetical protein